MTSKVLIIACGALSLELNQIKKLNSWDHVTIKCLNAELHNTPKLIPEKIEEKYIALKDDFSKVFIAYADCGTGGMLDSLLKAYDLERLDGAHCYEFFSGQKRFKEFTDQEIGTLYLTDFLVKHFQRLVVEGLAIDKYPELKDEYFKHYKKVVYLAQTRSESLQNDAKKYADFLDLDYSFEYTGLDNVQSQLNQAVN